MEYMDALGDTNITNKFYVLVLRQSPSDMFPPYPLVPKGAIDPTGLLFWLKLWPEWDSGLGGSRMVLGLREIIHQYKKNGRLVNNSDIAIKKTSELDKNSCGTKEGEGDHHDLQFASDPSACDASQPRKDFVGEASSIEELGMTHSDANMHEELLRARENISLLEKQVKELQERVRSG